MANKYIEQHYTLGELEAEKERLKALWQSIKPKGEDEFVDAKISDYLHEAWKELDMAFKHHAQSNCAVCGKIGLAYTEICYFGVNQDGEAVTNEDGESGTAEHCPKCGRKL